MKTSMAAAAPYADLDPAAVLDALDALGLPGDGRVLQLNSYENRVFQAHLDDGSAVVAKFYRPGRWSDAQILEEHGFARELAEADVPVVAPRVLAAAASTQSTARLVGTPPTLAHLELRGRPHRVAVADRHAGRAPELEDADVLTWLGRFIGRLHAVGASGRFAHRRTLGPDWGRDARHRLLDGGFIGEAQQPAWRAACDEALDLVALAFERAGALPSIRLHGDMHPGNVMWRPDAGGGPHIVDLDDACNGPAVQDLWMLLAGDAETMRGQLAPLLAGYRMFMRFDERELALIDALRTQRIVCWSAWVAERWDDPAFPAAFPWFGSAAYWATQTVHLREQIDAMRDPPVLGFS